MSEFKMDKWFRLPVSCYVICDGDIYNGSPDSIAIYGHLILTDHHADKVAIAINSYDSNQELIVKQAEQIKLLRDALTEIYDGAMDVSDRVWDITDKALRQTGGE